MSEANSPRDQFLCSLCGFNLRMWGSQHFFLIYVFLCSNGSCRYFRSLQYLVPFYLQSLLTTELQISICCLSMSTSQSIYLSVTNPSAFQNWIMPICLYLDPHTVVIISLLYFVELPIHYKKQQTYDLDCIIMGIGHWRCWEKESTIRHQTFDFWDLGVVKKLKWMRKRVIRKII